MFNTTKQTRHEFTGTYPAGIQSSTGGLSLPRAVYVGDPQIVQHLTALKVYTEVVYYIIRRGIITHLTEWSWTVALHVHNNFKVFSNNLYC